MEMYKDPAQEQHCIWEDNYQIIISETLSFCESISHGLSYIITYSAITGLSDICSVDADVYLVLSLSMDMLNAFIISSIGCFKSLDKLPLRFPASAY